MDVSKDQRQLISTQNHRIPHTRPQNGTPKLQKPSDWALDSETEGLGQRSQDVPPLLAKLGILFAGVLEMKALVFVVYIRAC